MAEFAVSLLVLVPIFIGVMDLGLAMYQWLQVTDMAEAGALYATTNAQQLYGGAPGGGGAFDDSGIKSAASSTGSGLTGATTTVVGVCSCPTAIANLSCTSSTPFQPTNGTSGAPAPYCLGTCAASGGGTISEGGYVCITTSYRYAPIISVPYIPPVTLSATSVVKIH